MLSKYGSNKIVMLRSWTPVLWAHFESWHHKKSGAHEADPFSFFCAHIQTKCEALEIDLFDLSNKNYSQNILYFLDTATPMKIAMLPRFMFDFWLYKTFSCFQAGVAFASVIHFGREWRQQEKNKVLIITLSVSHWMYKS